MSLKVKFFFLFIAIVIVKALSYWLVSWYQHPQDPLSSFVMYRVGDTEYFPFVSAVARFNFGENMLYEFKDIGIRSVPFMSLLFHGLCFRIFHEFGFIIADVIIAIAYFILLAKVFEKLGISTFMAQTASLLVVTSFTGAVLKLLAPSIPFRFIVNVSPWGWRMPRPFVTEVFLLLCFYFILKILLSKDGHKSYRSWVFLGLGFASLLQGDLFFAITVNLSISFLIILLLVRHREEWLSILKRFLSFCLATIVTCIPLILQRFYENKDTPRRLGLFSLDRAKPYFLTSSQFHRSDIRIELIFFLLIIALLAFVIRKYDQKDSQKPLGLYCLGALSLITYLTLPAFCMIFGKGLQFWHFQENFYRVLMLGLWVMLFSAADFAIGFLLRSSKQIIPHAERNIQVTIGVLAVCLSLWASISGAFGLSNNDQPMRYDMKEWKDLPEYRQNFVALVNELKTKKYEDAKVMGSFDWQIISWWLTFHEGWSYLADPCVTTVTDKEIENRLESLCKIIGMPPENFKVFINRRYVDLFWLGSDKYQAMKANTFAPIGEYSPEEQDRIKQTTILDSFELVIPMKEQERLVNEYRSLVLNNDRRLDLIVLGNDESLHQFEPNSGDYMETYHNSDFRVWKRKKH